MMFPDSEASISSPKELVEILRKAKQELARGTLRQINPSNSPFAALDLSVMPDQGPWPDYFEAYFEDDQGRRYKLLVETYHGSGGSWGPM